MFVFVLFFFNCYFYLFVKREILEFYFFCLQIVCANGVYNPEIIDWLLFESPVSLFHYSLITLSHVQTVQTMFEKGSKHCTTTCFRSVILFGAQYTGRVSFRVLHGSHFDYRG